MIALNLETKNKAQEQIKQYLEENVSEILAEKINNGVKISKDNKSLLNKKDLDSFWKFATEEARKGTNKTDSGAYVDNETVLGWAIHYFEEDSIEGKLYNEDGSIYKPVITKTTTPTIKKPEINKPEKLQTSLFDMLDNLEEEKTEEDIATAPEGNSEEENIIINDGNKINIETGEIIDPVFSCDNESTQLLNSIFDGKLVVKL